jgi:hypothetical protein
MTVETIVRCNRCGTLWNEECNIWMSMDTNAGESGERIAGGRIDLCDECETDFVRFMAGEVFHKFMEKSK